MREMIYSDVSRIAVIIAIIFLIYSMTSQMKGTFNTSNSCKIRIGLAFLVSLCYFIMIFLVYDNSFLFWGSICVVVMCLISIVITFKMKRKIEEDGKK